MDFISLDLEPKPVDDVLPETSSNFEESAPFYRSTLFKASILIVFIAIMCFPHPKWLSFVVGFPIGAILLACTVAIVLLPELEWWVVIIAVVSVYLLMALTGMIEMNLDTKRKKRQKQIEEMTQETKRKEEEKEQETMIDAEIAIRDESAAAPRQFNPSEMPMMMEPLAANAF